MTKEKEELVEAKKSDKGNKSNNYNKNKQVPKKKSIPLKEYVLLKDLPYDKGVKKKGTKVKLSKAGFDLLRSKGKV